MLLLLLLMWLLSAVAAAVRWVVRYYRYYCDRRNFSVVAADDESSLDLRSDCDRHLEWQSIWKVCWDPQVVSLPPSLQLELGPADPPAPPSDCACIEVALFLWNQIYRRHSHVAEYGTHNKSNSVVIR